jgi:tRNA threonylcarbamoyl adenosine modification protein YeaZ
MERLLASNGLEMRSADMFAVDIGPGGMTGLKIGIVTIRTLSQVLSIPVSPVSSLEALSRSAPDDASIIMPALPCTKSTFYAAMFRRSPGVAPERLSPDALLDQDSLPSLLSAAPADLPIHIVGDAPDILRAALSSIIGPRAVFRDPADSRPTAVAVCEIAVSGPPPSPFSDILPNYLCVTAAETNFGIKA